MVETPGVREQACGVGPQGGGSIDSDAIPMSLSRHAPTHGTGPPAPLPSWPLGTGWGSGGEEGAHRLWATKMHGAGGGNGACMAREPRPCYSYCMGGVPAADNTGSGPNGMRACGVNASAGEQEAGRAGSGPAPRGSEHKRSLRFDATVRETPNPRHHKRNGGEGDGREQTWAILRGIGARVG
jgi:hypothetical protein